MVSQNLWMTKCFQCIWASMSNVETIWDFDREINRYCFESFCYGSKSCKIYKISKPHTVLYKGSSSAMDTGWLDDLCIENRGFDE